MAVKQTAGREALGEFAPKFAELNDDVLFGQVWSRKRWWKYRSCVKNLRQLWKMTLTQQMLFLYD